MPSITREVLEERETPENEPDHDQRSPGKGNRRRVGCLALLLLQVTLFVVWGCFFFSLGLMVGYEDMPVPVRNLLVALVDFLDYMFF